MLAKLKNLIPVNWALLQNPANWIIVFLMVAIAGAGIAVIMSNKDAPTKDE
jgi:predicted membrane channel-forming protein YqfA (hemolysin III family)